MPKAQCYYEILGISEIATGDEVKKAYRNLALLWHPDKHQDDQEEAHAKFQQILKAYETLSDSREREWYDRHKDQILCEDDEEEADNLTSLFQYFSSSCYANFDDAEDGFYTVYRNLLEKVAEEETNAYQLNSRLNVGKGKQKKNDEPPTYPTFGDSNSDYDEIVRPFYAFWSGFCTNVTFDHLDKYKTTEAENRRILRAMEKENKKIKEAAKKERNTNVRKLIEFIKKRDKRIKAHKLKIEQQNELNRKKTAEKQRQQREKCLKESANYNPTAWDDMQNIEKQLRKIESEYESLETGKKRGMSRYEDEIDEEDSDEDEDNGDEDDEEPEPRVVTFMNDNEDLDIDESELEGLDFFCPACNKEFKSIKAFKNHEASKKHKQNVAKLTKLLQDDEEKLGK